MRIPRLYTQQPLHADSLITLDKDAARYLSSVLRMTSGQMLNLFNGEGGEYVAEVVSLSKNQVTVSIKESLPNDRESLLKIHLVIGISRGERMDWVIQKATELGVHTITPIFTERTEVKLAGSRLEKRLVHWQQVSISACEQCLRNVVPTINSAVSLQQCLGTHDGGLKIVLHHRTERPLTELQNTNNHVTILVGPEGGLSDDEITLAESNGYNAVKLGPRVLRTETAPLAAISILQSLWGDMG
jgi:16S rRNA (uracil1498-N3)-methyltransferase|tara:strand:- start:828 stop:1559 length:732 start_codon:yes stop_codon:yes gene_type:complete